MYASMKCLKVTYDRRNDSVNVRSITQRGVRVKRKDRCHTCRRHLCRFALRTHRTMIQLPHVHDRRYVFRCHSCCLAVTASFVDHGGPPPPIQYVPPQCLWPLQDYYDRNIAEDEGSDRANGDYAVTEPDSLTDMDWMLSQELDDETVHYSPGRPTHEQETIARAMEIINGK